MTNKEVKQLGRGDILIEVEYPRALHREHPAAKIADLYQNGGIWSWGMTN